MKLYSGWIHIQSLTAIFIAEPGILFLFPYIIFLFFLELNYPNLFIHLLFFESLNVSTCFNSSVKLLFHMIFYRWDNPSLKTFLPEPSVLFHLDWMLSQLLHNCLFLTIILGMMCLILFPGSCGFLFLKDFLNLKISPLCSHMCDRLAWYRILDWIVTQDFESWPIVS